MTDQQTKAEIFGELHTRDEPFLIPNPWDAGSAKLLASLGFDAEVRSGNSEIVAHCPRGVTFADGTVLPTYDFILRSYTVDSDPED